MDKGGLYIYCVVSSRNEQSFRGIGINKSDVLSVSYEDLSMMVSHHPMTRIVISKDNMLTHEKVIERVMQEFDSVLPIRFGTIAANADEIRDFLIRRHSEFRNLLRYVEHRIELNVKGIWRNIKDIYAEIVRENPAIREKKEKIVKHGQAVNIKEKYEVGMLVEKALARKKEEDANIIANYFRKTAAEIKMNKTGSDEIFLNAAFLVDRGREKEFDNLMDEVDRHHHRRMLFKYTGPLPVYNFVNVSINSGAGRG